MGAFDDRLGELDVQLYELVTSQTTDNDKQSLLACQLAIRSSVSSYRYLEIGSHLGGSIQPHLRDDRCARIYSIDKRSTTQPDGRGVRYTYEDNSTQRMLDALRPVAPEAMAKITCIDGDTRRLAADAIDDRIDLCFIDGEHTDDAVVADFRFCRAVLAQDGAIVFHDAHIVYAGLSTVVAELAEEAVAFHAYHLPDTVFVVELGERPLHRSAPIRARLLDNHVGYLASLGLNDGFRRFAQKPLLRAYRRLGTRRGSLRRRLGPLARRLGIRRR